MTTTYTALREGLSRLIGDWLSVTGAATGCTTTALKSTALAEYGNSYFSDGGYFILGPTGTSSAIEVRKVTSFVQSTYLASIFTNYPFTTAPTSMACELHKINPDKKKKALNVAIKSLYSWLRQEVVDETIMTEPNQIEYAVPSTITDIQQIFYSTWPASDTSDTELGSNMSFDNWTASAPDDWTASAQVTTAQEDDDDFVLSGSYSCKATIAASQTGTLYSDSVSSPTDYAGQRITFDMWVYCRTASRVKADIYDGSTTTQSSYHQGRGWERLSVSATMPTTPTALQGGISFASGTTALTIYCDDAHLMYRERKPTYEPYPLYGWDVYNSVLYLPASIVKNRLITLKGTTYLSTVDAEADTTEADEPQVQLLYAEAARYLYQELISTGPKEDITRHQQLAGYYSGEVERLKRRVGKLIPAHQMKVPGYP